MSVNEPKNGAKNEEKVLFSQYLATPKNKCFDLKKKSISDIIRDLRVRTCRINVKYALKAPIQLN